jgi:hypothetical protein
VKIAPQAFQSLEVGVKEVDQSPHLKCPGATGSALSAKSPGARIG